MSTPASGFPDLGLRAELLSALSELGYEEPTPIQSAAIGPLLEGRDLLGQADTGTGKTAAFALPLLQRLPDGGAEARGGLPSALVLAPTRELAMQVSEAVHRYGRALGVRVLAVYGGSPVVHQRRVLERGVDVVVATPGRALDLLARRSLDLSQLRTVVLDEADEMLDMGFSEDIEAILEAAPAERQTVLFSATMPARIERLARNHLSDPVRLELAGEGTAAGEAPLVRQSAYMVARAHKPAALGRILDLEAPTAAIVFCRTRAEVDQVTETLNGRGYRAEALHGGIAQDMRARVVERLRSGAVELVVATDVAARGLDVDVLTHVVNYDVPAAAEAYVHRIGRVGRAGREGVAITLAQPREHRMLKAIERLTGTKIAIETLPTVADLRARRLELTTAALRETILAGELDSVRYVVERLSEEFDVIDVARAAVKLAHEATTGGAEDDEEEIPEVRETRYEGRTRDRSGGKGKSNAKRGPSGDTTRLFVAAGRGAGVRPQDIVGAFANESQLRGADIGAIEIHDRHTLVEVPKAAADAVIAEMSRTRIKGKKANIRHDAGRGSSSSR